MMQITELEIHEESSTLWNVTGQLRRCMGEKSGQVSPQDEFGDAHGV